MEQKLFAFFLNVIANITSRSYVQDMFVFDEDAMLIFLLIENSVYINMWIFFLHIHHAFACFINYLHFFLFDIIKEVEVTIELT